MPLNRFMQEIVQERNAFGAIGPIREENGCLFYRLVSTENCLFLPKQMQNQNLKMKGL